MIVGSSYEGGEVVLYHDDGDVERIPFTPRMLLPRRLAPTSSSFTVDPAPGGVYVSGDYKGLLRLYSRLSSLSSAVVFPPPDRQYLLLHHLRPFSRGLIPITESLEAALYHLVLTPDTPDPALTFLENTLFLHGYARSLRRISSVKADTGVLRPFFHFNVDESTITPDGEVLLPTSLVKVPGYRELRSLHPLLGNTVLGDRGVVTLADALLHDLPYEMLSERRASKYPSFLHRAVLGIFNTFLSSLRSMPRGLDPSDPSPYFLLLVSRRILLKLPDLFLNTLTLGFRGRNTLLTLYRLLKRDPNLYNLLVSEIDTCCPASRELESYLPVLSSLLMEPLRS